MPCVLRRSFFGCVCNTPEVRHCLKHLHIHNKQYNCFKTYYTSEHFKPDTHYKFLRSIQWDNGKKQKKTGDRRTNRSDISVAISPRCAFVFWQGESPQSTHWLALTAIGWEHFSDVGFPACPFDKKWSLDQPLSDRLLYTVTKCRLVSVAHVYPALGRLEPATCFGTVMKIGCG